MNTLAQSGTVQSSKVSTFVNGNGRKGLNRNRKGRQQDLKKKKDWQIPPMIYAAALDEIFAAMKGLRIFDRFGFKAPPHQKQDIPATYIEEYQDWHYDLSLTDWMNYGTGGTIDRLRKRHQTF